MALDVILESFGFLGETFSDLGRSWEQAWNVMHFQGFPETPQVERTTPVEGNRLVQLGSRLQPRNILAVEYKPVSCKFTNFQRMHL